MINNPVSCARVFFTTSIAECGHSRLKGRARAAGLALSRAGIVRTIDLLHQIDRRDAQNSINQCSAQSNRFSLAEMPGPGTNWDGFFL